MKILIHGRAFPVAMWRWFDWSLRDMGHEVFSVGYYNGGKIPWGDQFNYPQYDFPPDLAIPEVAEYPLEEVLKVANSRGFKPDLIIQASDVTHLVGKAPCKMVLIKTDPHSVDYSSRVLNMDHVFSMQNFYRKPGESWLPYAYYPPVHKRIAGVVEQYDVVFSGLQYGHRIEALKAIEAAGFVVSNQLGLIYDEYVQRYNEGLIAFNWSSKEDLPARFWEGLAMGRLVLTNRIQELLDLNCKEGTHYIAFSSVEEAVDKVKYYTSHTEEAERIMLQGYEWVKKHTYESRMNDMLKVIKTL